MNTNFTPYQLDPEFYDRLKSLQNRVPDVKIASGYRSDFQQQALRDEAQAAGKNPDDWFAPAGESAHNYGLAADLTGNLADVHRYAPLYGLYHALTQDPWHIEPAYVTEKGLPYRPPQATPQLDYLSTAPTGDKGLDANLQNQADARAAQRAQTVPAGVPMNMLDPSLRMNLPEARSGNTVIDTAGPGVSGPAGAAVTQSLGTKTPAPDQGVSPEQPKQTPPSVTGTPDMSAQIASGTGALQQVDQLRRNKLQDALNQNATNQNRLSSALAQNAANVAPGSVSGSAIVNAMMSQVGKPYSTSGRFGPNAFDCSGITVFGLRAAGIDPGSNVVSTTLQQWGQPIDIATALRTPGAMLFVWGQGAAGHVEVSRGDGTTIGSSSGGVQVRSGLNRGWTGAALPPGVGAGNFSSGNLNPVSVVPQRVTPSPQTNAQKYASFTIARTMDIMKRGGLPGNVPTPVTAPQAPVVPSPQETQGIPPLQPDQAAAQAQASTAPVTLPAGAPPPASQPGNPNPVGATVAVAPGQTPEQAEAQAASNQVTLPAGTSQGQGLALGANALEQGKTAVAATVSPTDAAAEGAQAAQGKSGSAANAGSMDANGWLAYVAAAEHLTPQETMFVHAAMMRESGGRNIPQGISDVNTAHGTPAFGPLQIIQPTFNSYADQGWDWHNPIDSMRAAIRYARARYGGGWAQRMASSGY